MFIVNVGKYAIHGSKMGKANMDIPKPGDHLQLCHRQHRFFRSSRRWQAGTQSCFGNVLKHLKGLRCEWNPIQKRSILSFRCVRRLVVPKLAEWQLEGTTLRISQIFTAMLENKKPLASPENVVTKLEIPTSCIFQITHLFSASSCSKTKIPGGI